MREIFNLYIFRLSCECSSGLCRGIPPWILKQGGLETYVQRIVSLDSNTKSKAFVSYCTVHCTLYFPEHPTPTLQLPQISHTSHFVLLADLALPSSPLSYSLSYFWWFLLLS